MVVGRILQRCGERLKGAIAPLSPAEYFARHGGLEMTAEYERPEGLAWDDERYVGAAYGTYGYACDVVEVALDSDTFEAAVTAVTSVHEVGTVINPTLAVGQIEGGTAQGLGMALLEEVVMRDGRMVNAQLTNYIIPTSADTPPMDVVTIEQPYAHGPFGAKGLGEMPIDGPAGAVVNALRHAGVVMQAIPATPEQIMEATCSSR